MQLENDEYDNSQGDEEESMNIGGIPLLPKGLARHSPPHPQQHPLQTSLQPFYQDHPLHTGDSFGSLVSDLSGSDASAAASSSVRRSNHVLGEALAAL